MSKKPIARKDNLSNDPKKAKKGLGIGARELQSILNTTEEVAQMGSWRWDLRTQKVDWSDGMFRLFEVERDGFDGDVNRIIAERIHPDDAEAVLESNRNVLENAQAIPLSYRIVLPDGTERTVWAQGKLIHNEAGKPIALAGYVQDITERVRVEQALRESEEKMSSIFRVAPTGIGVVRDRVLLDVNYRICEMTGYKKEELIGQSARILYPTQEDFDFVGSEKYRQIAQTGSGQVETRWQKKDGSIIDILLASTPIDFNDLSKGVTFTALDITERVRVENALRESEDKFKYIFDNAVVAKSITEPDGRLHVNQAFCDLVGYSEQELQGRNWREITHPDDIELNVTELNEVLAGKKESARFIKRYIHKNGKIVWVDVSTSLRRDVDGKPLYFMTTVLDVTTQVQAAEALHKLSRQDQEALRIARMGHWEFDFDSGQFLFNDQYYALHGTTAEAAGGYVMPAQEFAQKYVHPDDAHLVAEHLRQATEATDPDFQIQAEARLLRADGQPRYATVWFRIEKDSQGRTVKLYGVNQDITERKQAEESIRQSERQMKALVTSLDDIVFEFDGDGVYLNIWTADESLLAQPKAKILGKQVFEVMGREHGSSFYDAIRRVLAEGAPESIEYPLDVVGGQRWFMARISPILAPDGSRHTVSVLVRDITGRKQIEEQVRVQLQRVRALNEIDRAISSGLDLRLSLNILLDQVVSQLDVDAACVLTLEPSSQMLGYESGKGFRSPAIRQSRMPLGQGLAGQAGLERRMVHVQDLKSLGENFMRRDLLSGEQFVEYIGVPLVAKGILKGVLEVFHRAHLDPDMEWLHYLETLGGQAAIAIDNAQLYEGMQRSNMELMVAYDATIEGWSHAMDLRDKETEGHTLRVTELAIQLARKMGVSQQEVTHMRRGALLHDIGKLGVPDHILYKPDKLDEAEWTIMRQHPNYAFDMLISIHYLRPALDIPYCHHEKWDGSGYPRGLKGEEIPLAARIFAIVDVWDALRSDRPYRTSWPVDKVRQFISEESGRHFDPQVVEAFLDLMEESPDLF